MENRKCQNENTKNAINEEIWKVFCVKMWARNDWNRNDEKNEEFQTTEYKWIEDSFDKKMWNYKKHVNNENTYAWKWKIDSGYHEQIKEKIN